MVRFTILTLLSLCMISWVQSEEPKLCKDILDKYTTCFFNSPKLENDDDFSIDEAACNECVAKNKNFEQFDSCDEATNKICSYFDACYDVCFPKDRCPEEDIDYYACSFGDLYAPEGCIVTCGGVDGGNGSNGGGGENVVDDPNESASAGSATSTNTALSSTMFILSVVAALFS